MVARSSIRIAIIRETAVTIIRNRRRAMARKSPGIECIYRCAAISTGASSLFSLFQAYRGNS